MKVGVPIGLMCRNPVLREELLAAWPDARLNEDLGIMSEDEMIAFLGDCEAAIVGREPVTDKVLSALPNLKVIGKFGVGCEDVDFDALRRHGVRFGYLPGVNKLSVAELAEDAHFAARGCKVVGDPEYGKVVEGDRALWNHARKRLALHAAQLRFAHPVTGARLTIRAPLPEGLAGWLEAVALSCPRRWR